MVLFLANRKNIGIREYSFYSLLDMGLYNTSNINIIIIKQNEGEDL
jgi:hypothetical protein